MRWLWCFLLGVALSAQAQTLCFSAPATCPQNSSLFFQPQVSPALQLPPPRVVMPILKPVVPLELSPVTEPFFLTGTVNLMLPSSAITLAPFSVYGGSSAEGAYSGGAGGGVYGGSTASGVEVPHISSGSSAGGGVTVNTGFGPH
jgi:hypothetical protein